MEDERLAGADDAGVVEDNNLKKKHKSSNEEKNNGIIALYLCVKDLARLDGVVGLAQYEPWRHLRLFHPLQLDLDVLPAHHLGHLDVVRPQGVDLHLEKRRGFNLTDCPG